MSIGEMRSIIRNVYSGQKWKDRVDRMPDYQVLAIYNRFVNDGKIK